ncbi:MAG: hypothetical protein ABJP48_01070 [Erythrobacter sp.]
MQTPRNPTRRSRNIGTAKQGHGQNNRLVIPDRSDGVYWLDHIGRHKHVVNRIAGKEVNFIIEANTEGFLHPCSVADVEHVLSKLPASDWAGLDTFVFRQPTRKQQTLSLVWGRLLYHAEITTDKGQKIAKGPVVFLEAVKQNSIVDWSTSLDPDDQRELKRLKCDGHEIDQSGRTHRINVTAKAARNTQLYRTLIHEIGHWFDWLSKVEQPAANGKDFASLERRYFARPRAEREAFAHRYADEMRKNLEQSHVIPFDPLP